LPINHLLCENRRTAGRIGEDGLVDALPAQSLQNPVPCHESQDFSAAISEIEAAAWAERGIFEGDLTLPGPLVQNDRFNERFGPAPDATLNFKEDPQQTAAALKRAKEVLQL
jgi:hypothetical protein